MVWGPTTVGMKLNAHTSDIEPQRELVRRPPRVQLAKALLATSALKLTVPLGVFVEVGVLSLALAFFPPRRSSDLIAGMQLTSVLVSCLRAVTTKAPELPRWLASPP